MDEAKNVAEDVAVVRLLLEAHEFGVDPVQTLVGLGQELTEQVVHTRRLVRTRACRPALHAPSPPARRTRAFAARCRRLTDRLSVLPKGLISVAAVHHTRFEGRFSAQTDG